tara:strand:+ start:276 stop:587 length:312 start_codon:yes stop_codon:yes gene_type:complete
MTNQITPNIKSLSSVKTNLEKVSESLNGIQNEKFTEEISNAIKSVARSQMDSANITKDFELGKETDLSKVMIQQQVSSLGFQLTLNVRNKLLSAYKDIMNMPV